MAKTNDILRKDKKNADLWKKNDMSYCLPARDHKTLQEAAYQDFSQSGSEGKTHRIYLDCLGNPTVGVGHLIMPRSGLNNAKVEAAYRQKYMALDLRDANGNQISDAEKYSQFSSILQAMKDKSFKTTGGMPDYVTYPAVSKLSEKGVQEAFNSDYDYWYNRVKGKFPDLDKYPLSLQLSLTHCGFAGALGKVKNSGNFADIAEKVAKVRSSKICSSKEKQMAQMAARECRYLADMGLDPLNSSRDNLMMALNVSEPIFNNSSLSNEIDGQGAALADNRSAQEDNIGAGSLLRGLFSGDENDGDILDKVMIQALMYALKNNKTMS